MNARGAGLWVFLSFSAVGPSVALESMTPVPSTATLAEWSVPCVQTPYPEAKNSAFDDHETLQYTVRWGALTAGRGRIEVQGIETLRGRPVYHLSMSLGTTGVTRSLHAYSEKTDTWMDRQSLLPLRYKKETREGRYARDEDVNLDPACRRLDRLEHRLDKGTTERKQAALPGPTLDILGYLFYLRTLPLAVGKSFDLTLVSGDHLWPVTVTVKKRLKISTPAGWFDCFFIEPSLRSVAQDAKLRELQVWITADEHKLPVRLRMAANIGHIVAEYAPNSPSSSN